jgi:hypothetical protein
MTRRKPPTGRARRILAGALLAAVLLTGAAEVRADYAMIGLGGSSCGSWSAWRRDRLAGDAQQWVVGFLSGIGFVGDDGDNPLRSVDAQGVWAWVDNHCRANPIDKISAAAKAFYRAHPN